ncbi:MAG TPA: hypothetical protein VK928_08100 [Longimicrobiales bacterium]|nr:hypothetical protein [Longimicrobiales bacterium]
MWIDNPILLSTGGVLAVLFVLARVLPRQRWLEPFRPHNQFRPPRPTLEEFVAQREQPPAQQSASDQWGAAKHRPPMQMPTPRMVAHQRSTRRFQRIEAGFGFVILGFVILGGFAALAMMTGNDPAEEAPATLARVLAGICFVVGVLVLFVPGRKR